jgi:hypothetical protein
MCYTQKQERDSLPLTVAVTLALLLFLCAASEGIRLMIIAQGVRDAVQSAVISTVNDNYENVYHGVREGYSGAYQPSAAEFEQSLNYSDVYGRLDKVLGLTQENGYQVKYTEVTWNSSYPDCPSAFETCRWPRRILTIRTAFWLIQ